MKKMMTTSYNYGNKETEYLFCVKGRPFPCLVSPHLPTPTSTLIDFDLVHKLGLKMVDLQCKKFSYAGHKMRILGKLSTNVQFIIDGTSVGQFQVKAMVVKDLEKNLDTECVASAKMAAQLRGEDDICTSSGALSQDCSPAATPAVQTPPRSPGSRPTSPTPSSSKTPSPTRSPSPTKSPPRSPPGFPTKPQYPPPNLNLNHSARNCEMMEKRFQGADRRRNKFGLIDHKAQLQHLREIDPNGHTTTTTNNQGIMTNYIMSNNLIFGVGHGRIGCKYEVCQDQDPPDNCGFNDAYTLPTEFEPCGERCQGGWCKCLVNYRLKPAIF